MSMGSRIRELREIRGLSRADLAELIGVSPSSISNYENSLSAPKEATLYALFDVLKCDANYLYQDYMDNVEIFSTTFDEQELIRKYRLLDSFDRETLNTLIHRLLIKGKQFEVNLISHPVFMLPASAGKGQFLDSDNYELRDFPEDIVPRDSNFAVRISGDSMEPDYPDESIVFVKQMKNLRPGDVGIFTLNGEGYIKELGTENNLISHNEDYKDIHIGEYDDLRVVGKVIGDPYVEE